MITYQLLKQCPQHIPALAQLWHDVLGKIWAPDVVIADVERKFHDHLNHDKLPITIVALRGDMPVGMASLRLNDGIREDLSPWLGSLCVTPEYQGQGIGAGLMEQIKIKAKGMGYSCLHLFTFDSSLPAYYTRHQWHIIGKDHFRGHVVTVMGADLTNLS